MFWFLFAAAHQSGHNSGVVHAGIYYAPGSLRAKLCTQGIHLAYKYCDEKGIAYKKVGKLIVATESSEVTRLEVLYRRAQANGVKDVRWLEADGIRKIEPNCQGIAAIWSPNTGIVDWAEVTRSYGNDFKALGGVVFHNFEVSSINFSSKRNEVEVSDLKFRRLLKARYVITAAGLHADRISKLTGCSYSPRIVPFRGEYLLLKPEKSHLVKTNIYPVPDLSFPFLGVHFTPRMDGSVWLGPNAVLAFQREGYSMSDISIRDTFESLAFGGFQKLAFKHFRQGIDEMYRSVNLTAQVELLRKFVPSLSVADVIRGPSGVRAQALDASGHLLDDFVFDSGQGQLSDRVIHVRNAPSPGATSSLAIAKMIADKANKSFHLS